MTNRLGLFVHWDTAEADCHIMHTPSLADIPVDDCGIEPPVIAVEW